jgi:hypothetical protein
MPRRSSDSWLISDIYLNGAISEATSRRSRPTLAISFCSKPRGCGAFWGGPLLLLEK